MGNIRMLPVRGSATAWAGSPTNAAARRYYNASAGQTLDVTEEDAKVISSTGFFAVGQSGATAERPNNKYLEPGTLFVDTSLLLVIAWDGLDWRNPVSGAVA